MIKKGDCLELVKNIKSESVDLILSDPPYGMGYTSSWTIKKPIINDNNTDWVDPFAKECYRILKDNRHCYIFCSYHKIDVFKQAFEKYFKIKNVLTWVKNNHGSGDLLGNYAPKTEFILFCSKGRRLLNGRRDTNVLNYKKTNNALHTTQKPVDLLTFLIEKSTFERERVIDCFAGSGSTGVACLGCNRRFIGFEIDSDNYKIMKKRLKEIKLNNINE